jgi:hypothetical protein
MNLAAQLGLVHQPAEQAGMSAAQTEASTFHTALQASNRAMLRLGPLTRLRRLGLAGTSLKDAGLALVTPLAALETLSLEWCSRITDAGAQGLGF